MRCILCIYINHFRSFAFREKTKVDIIARVIHSSNNIRTFKTSDKLYIQLKQIYSHLRNGMRKIHLDHSGLHPVMSRYRKRSVYLALLDVTQSKVIDE